jgi:hypothetical protein
MPIPIITTLGESAVARMLHDAQSRNTEARQADAAKRLFMLQENWRHIVYAYVNSIYKTDTVKQNISKRIKRTFNILLQITRRVCVVYKQPPVRRLKGAPQAAQEAWSALMREAQVATKMQDVEKRVFAANVDILVPTVYEDPSGRGKRLRYDELLPHCTEVYTSDHYPMGPPESAVYTVKSGSDFDGQPLRTAALDAYAVRYYDQRDRLVRTEEHGAGIFPGVPFRLEHPIDDWWCSDRGSGVVEATTEGAHLLARLDWVRNGQDRYREVMASEELARISTQVAGAEGPLEIPVNPDSFRYDVFDVNTAITNHEAHIKLYLHQAAESVGVPSVLVDFDFTGSNTANTNPQAAAAQHAALADLRNQHIEWYREAERELAWRTALVLQGSGHPLASLLSPDMVEDTFEIEYPELTFVEAPQARIAVAKDKIAVGLSSTFREYQREHPSLTFEEAEAEVMRIAEEEGRLNELYIRNNWPRGAAEKQTLAQAQGAQGGQASGVARHPQDDPNDNAEQPGRADPAIPGQ